MLKHILGPRNKQEIKKVAEEIQLSIPTTNPSLLRALQQLFCMKSIFFPFMLVVYLAVYFQLTGVPLTTVYAGYVFSKAGDSNPNLTAFFASGLVFLIASVLCTLAVEVIGRKILLASSAAGMFVACTMLGFHNYFTRPSLCRNLNETESSQSSEHCNQHLFPLAVAGVVLLNLSFDWAWEV